MKIYLTILFLIICQNIFGQNTLIDTIFIRKDSLKGVSQSVFFETNKNSKFYEKITSFKFDSFDKVCYDNSIEYFRKNNIKLQKQKTDLPSNKWITLKQYRGEYCAYYPCDFYTQYQISINDTTFIDWSGIGPIANKIVSQMKLNEISFEIKLNGINYIDRIVRINIIDKIKGIAIFTIITENEEINYLMIMAENIKTVPFIVNNCEHQKESEIDFEEPNFEKLLISK